MNKETQISALISDETRDMVERHVRATGVKKGWLIEQALRHHLQALHELPAEFIVPVRVTLTPASGEALAAAITKGHSGGPLRRLMRDGNPGAKSR